MKQITTIFPSVTHSVEEMDHPKTGKPGFQILFETNIVQYGGNRKSAYVVPKLGMKFWVPQEAYVSGDRPADIFSVKHRDMRDFLGQYKKMLDKALIHIDWSKAAPAEMNDKGEVFIDEKYLYVREQEIQN